MVSLAESATPGDAIGMGEAGRKITGREIRHPLKRYHMHTSSNLLIFNPFVLSLSKDERIKNPSQIKPFMLRQGSPERSRRAQHERLDLTCVHTVA
jgi:hypothetical protein